MIRPTSSQQEVLSSSSESTLVIGSAGTGKTTLAILLASRAPDHASRSSKVLFLSFSRSAVARLRDRVTESSLRIGTFEITTFHAFAFRLVKQWGHLVGISIHELESQARGVLDPRAGGLAFDDLICKAVEVLKFAPIRDHYRRRWQVMICDEYQDVSDKLMELLLLIRGEAKLYLFADPDQCIYEGLSKEDGVSALRRLQQARTQLGCDEFELLDGSQRDPSGTMESIAREIAAGCWTSNACLTAIQSGALVLEYFPDLTDGLAHVNTLAKSLPLSGQRSLGIMTHHKDTLSLMSRAMFGEGVKHDVAGLDESFRHAVEFVQNVVGYHCKYRDWTESVEQLAFYFQSMVRGRTADDIAMQVFSQTYPFFWSIDEFRVQIDQCKTVGDVFHTIETQRSLSLLAPQRFGSAWVSALTTVKRAIGLWYLKQATIPESDYQALKDKLNLMTARQVLSVSNPSPVGVHALTLYQSKGREFDQTIVVLCDTDYFGHDRDAEIVAKRLAYVAFSRARERTHVVVCKPLRRGPFVGVMELI